MDYDTPLLTGAQLVDQTGVQDLDNLVTTAELVLDTFALNAHRAVWRKLHARGIDPTALTTAAANRLKDAVAYEAVGRLALAGYLGSTDGAAMLAMSASACGADFRPEYTTGDSPGSGSDGIPCVGHLDSRTGETFSGDFPSVT